MARTKKKETKVKITYPKVKREPGYFQVLIKKDDKVIKTYKKLSKLEFLRLYFNSIDSNIEKHPEYKAEDFIKSYTLIWNNYQIFSDYIDSYGHRWHNSGLSDKAKIEFINNIQLLFFGCLHFQIQVF